MASHRWWRSRDARSKFAAFSVVAATATFTACGGSESATEVEAPTVTVAASEPAASATDVAPTTVAPTTVAPTTVAPTTVAPTTVAPTTVAPTSSVLIGTSSADETTQFLDQWVKAWNDGDEEALFGVFLPDGVLVGTDNVPLVGGQVAAAWSHFVPQYSMKRTGDATPNDDGSFSFAVEWSKSELLVDRRILDITLDGDTVRMVERFDR